MSRYRGSRARQAQWVVMRVIRRAWVALVLLLLALAAAASQPATIRAQEGTAGDGAVGAGSAGANAADGPELGGVSGFDAGDWLGLGLRLAIVLAVIWVAVLAMRWYVRRSTGTPMGGHTRHVEVLETRALGPNRALHLVRLGDRAVLVGATAERINALMELADPDEVARLSEPAPGDVAPRTLRSMMGGLTGLLAALFARAAADGPAALRHARRGVARHTGGPARADTSLPAGAPLTHGVGGFLGVRLRDLPGASGTTSASEPPERPAPPVTPGAAE